MPRRETGTRKGRRNGEAGQHSGETSTTRIPRDTVYIGGLKTPSTSRSLVVIVGISTVCIHPREFLFVSYYRFVSRPVPALADDAAKPFARDL